MNRMQAHSRALDIMAARRLKSKEQTEKRRSELFASIEGLAQLESEINSAGLSALRAAIVDGGDSETLTKTIEKLRAKQRELLKSCGVDEHALETQYTCRDCSDTGYLPDGRPCHCLRDLTTRILRDDINKSTPLELSKFENFSLEYYPEKLVYYPNGDKNGRAVVRYPRRDAQFNLKTCREFAQKFPNSGRDLLLLGDAGLGKTHLALSIANELLNRGFDVIYCSAAAIFQRIEDERVRRDTEAGTLDELKSCSLLILDDLGAECTNAYTKSVLYDLINTRRCAKRLTVYTTNLVAEGAMMRMYGEKVSSRLEGGCIMLPFTGEDIRIKLGSQN